MDDEFEATGPISDEDWEAAESALRTELLDVQHRMLAMARFPLVVLVHGVDGAGRSEAVRWLTEWMDPRHIQTVAFREPTSEERERPPNYRFFRRLPPKGRIAVFFDGWYTEPVVARIEKRSGHKEFDHALAGIVRHETMLAAEDVVVLKFWFHLSRKAMRRRLEHLEKDADTAYRVTKREWDQYEIYDRIHDVWGDAMRSTDLPEVPWHVIDGSDLRAAGLAFGRAIRDAITDHLKANEPKPSKPPAKKTAKAEPFSFVPPPGVDLSRIRSIDLTKTTVEERYEAELDKWQRRLALATRRKRFAKLSPVLVFEGMDAAGKGGAIRRITRSLDPRAYELVPIAAPTDEEKAQPYLWRFWRHAPRDGEFAIFDRSWYGRVLVERVEGYIGEADWKRAYDEINDFEAQLAEHGAVVVKFWMHISLDVQLARFRDRQEIEWKNFKIGPDDWRNREKWPAYEVAAAQMFDRTSTEHAPWHLIPANDKHHARIAVLKATVKAIESALDR